MTTLPETLKNADPETKARAKAIIRKWNKGWQESRRYYWELAELHGHEPDWMPEDDEVPDARQTN